MSAFDTTSWKEVATNELEDSVSLAGFLADGHTLIAISGLGESGGGSLFRIDGETLELIGTPTRAHDGSPKAIAVSPDHRLVVTGAGDGVVRVWEGATGELLHEVLVEGQAQGVEFLDEQRIAVAPYGGNILVFALDRQVLWETVRQTLTRGFTPEECQRFEFDPCPTLEELRGD